MESNSTDPEPGGFYSSLHKRLAADLAAAVLFGFATLFAICLVPLAFQASNKAISWLRALLASVMIACGLRTAVMILAVRREVRNKTADPCESESHDPSAWLSLMGIYAFFFVGFFFVISLRVMSEVATTSQRARLAKRRVVRFTDEDDDHDERELTKDPGPGPAMAAAAPAYDADPAGATTLLQRSSSVSGTTRRLTNSMRRSRMLEAPTVENAINIYEDLPDGTPSLQPSPEHFRPSPPPPSLSGRTDSGLVLEPIPRELPWVGARKFFILSGVCVTIAFCVNMIPIIADVSKGTAFLLLALPLLLVLALVWIWIFMIRDHVLSATTLIDDRGVWVVGFVLVMVGSILRLLLNAIQLLTEDDTEDLVCDTTGSPGFIDLAFLRSAELGLVVVPTLMCLALTLPPSRRRLRREDAVQADGTPARERVSWSTRYARWVFSWGLDGSSVIKASLWVALLALLIGLVGYAFHTANILSASQSWLRHRAVFWGFFCARLGASLCTFITIIAMLSINRALSHSLFGRILGPGFSSTHHPLKLHSWLGGLMLLLAIAMHVGGHIVAALATAKHNDPSRPHVYESLGTLFRSLSGISGLVMVAGVLTLCTTGLLVSMRYRIPFHIFFRTHVPSAVIYLVLFLFHGTEREFGAFPYNGLVMFLALLVILVLYTSFRVTFPSSTIHVYRTLLARTKKEGEPSIVILRFQTPPDWSVRGSVRFGSFGLISMRDGDVSGSHPFTIVAVDNGRCELHIQNDKPIAARGGPEPAGWTRMLNHAVLERTAPDATARTFWATSHTPDRPFELFLRGPLHGPISGSRPALAHATHVVLYGTGVGATPMLSTLFAVMDMRAAEQCQVRVARLIIRVVGVPRQMARGDEYHLYLMRLIERRVQSLNERLQADAGAEDAATRPSLRVQVVFYIVYRKIEDAPEAPKQVVIDQGAVSLDMQFVQCRLGWDTHLADKAAKARKAAEPFYNTGLEEHLLNPEGYVELAPAASSSHAGGLLDHNREAEFKTFFEYHIEDHRINQVFGSTAEQSLHLRPGSRIVAQFCGMTENVEPLKRWAKHVRDENYYITLATESFG